MTTSQTDQWQAFLAVIADRPDDDGARLVFADFLEEQGESDRAELIRIQIDLSNGSPHDCVRVKLSEMGQRNFKGMCKCRRCNLRSREHKLLALHGRAWSAPVRALLPRCQRCEGDGRIRYIDADGLEYSNGSKKCQTCHGSGIAAPCELRWSRGFIHHITAPCAVLFGQECDRCRGEPSDTCRCTPGIAADLWRVQPITDVVLIGAEPYRFDTDDWAWWDGSQHHGGHPESDLPLWLYDRLADWTHMVAGCWKSYPTEALALSALSTAAVHEGRARAGVAGEGNAQPAGKQ